MYIFGGQKLLNVQFCCLNMYIIGGSKTAKRTVFCLNMYSFGPERTLHYVILFIYSVSEYYNYDLTQICKMLGQEPTHTGHLQQVMHFCSYFDGRNVCLPLVYSCIQLYHQILKNQNKIQKHLCTNREENIIFR